MTPSKTLFFLCLSFIVGIFIESIIKVPQIFLWAFLFLAVLLIFASLFFKKLIFIAGFCLFFLILGILRIQISEFNVVNDKLSKFNGTGQVVLQGFVFAEPDLRDTSQKIVVKAQGSKILITTTRYPEYKYSDQLKITGKLEKPFETEEFSYKNYLMKDGIYSVMGFPKISVIGRQKPNFAQAVYSGVLFIKGKLRQSLDKNFSPPESLILKGIILGDKTAIPQDVKNQLSITGVSHIIAVSGQHVVILTSMLMAFLLALGLWRQQAFYFSSIFICFYIILVGLPASGVRSAIMGILCLLGQKLGRQAWSSRIIVLAGALMLFQNPFLLVYDIGFQLSFLAVLGLVYAEPLIRMFVKFLALIIFLKKLEGKYDSWIMMFSATISAQIFTLPVIIYNFGNISFISPLANILLLPIVYYLMLFGFLSAVFGAIFSWLGWILSLPCYFLMVYFLAVVKFFSKPWAYKMVENVHWVWLLISYMAISFGTWRLNKKYFQKFT